ncbi:MAG: hypothetical protein IM597_12420 [Pseudanabaena sp. M176S2SP2A07QC]|nr:hypothetical protein [Pseudanabaena sp. M176S2SP2A07QC]MCA6622034.1 hypothetical protein [Pseudanabaena sp. M165S2SP1A06QC]
MTAIFTNNTFHNSQILLSDKVRRYATWSSHAIFGSAIVLSLASFIPSHWSSKLVNASLCPLLFVVSNKLDKLAMYASGYQGISEQRSHSAYSNWLDASLSPPKREVAIAPPVVAPPAAPKLADIKEALSKPHCMLLGSTGNGKSTLAKYLAANCNAFTIAIDPHAAPNDWGEIPVFGAGRRYGEIAEIMQATLQLMQVRYDARDKGVTQFEPIVIITDEFPAIIASNEAGEVASNWMKLISREARKVAIRLVVLTQSPEVQAIGLKGEGSVRDNFCFIRLGEFALDHAKSLKDDGVKQFIESAPRPAMLGNLPVSIPDLSSKVAMPKVAPPRDYLEIVDSPVEIAAAPDSQLSASPQSTAIAPVFQKIINFLDGRDWTRDNYIKQSITDFKNADTPIEEIQGYLQFLEVQGHLETRGAGRNGLEARKI